MTPPPSPPPPPASLSSGNEWNEWVTECLHPSPSSPTRKNKLQSRARDYFTNFANQSQQQQQEEGRVGRELALLLSKLGPVLSSSSTMTRILGLECWTGALEGIGSATQRLVSAGSPSPLLLPMETVRSMGRYLCEHCHVSPNTVPMTVNPDGSIVPSEGMSVDVDVNMDGDGEDVRDAAVNCIRALLSCPLLSPCLDTNDGEGKEKEKMRVQCMTCIQLRMEIARLALLRRCASLDHDDDDDDVDDDMEYATGYETRESDDHRVLSGLSLLPRAKRSLCFQLLESVVDGIALDTSTFLSVTTFAVPATLSTASTATSSTTIATTTTTTIQQTKAFATLAAACLHGETDPRCLLQALRLLHKVQTTLSSISQILSSSSNTDTHTHVNLVASVSISLFDAVAPYYPIRFKPPPDDPYGITREGLRKSLLDVLCFDTSIPHNDRGDNHDDNDEEEMIKESMTVLAARLFFERMTPPSSDPYSDDYDDGGDNPDNPTVHDRLEALQDLKRLLFGNDNEQDGMDDLDASSSRISTTAVSNLDNSTVTQLSQVLVRCHEDASASAILPSSDPASSTQNDSKEDGNAAAKTNVETSKLLANACRRFASLLAYHFERYHSQQQRQPPPQSQSQSKSQSQQQQQQVSKFNSSTFWELFVADTVRQQSPILATSPQSMKGRTVAAYLSSLSGCGGERTLRLCLDCCLGLLLGLFPDVGGGSNPDDDDDGNDNGQFFKDQEQITSALYSIAALFSSCRVSMECIAKDGVVVHPHPLEKWAVKAARVHCFLLRFQTKRHGGQKVTRMMVNVKVALVKALESILQSTPAFLFGKEDVELVRDTVMDLVKVSLLVGRHDDDDDDDDGEDDHLDDDGEVKSDDDGNDDDDVDEEDGESALSEWKMACARLIGSSIGGALRKGSEDGVGQSVESSVPDARSPSSCILDTDPEIVSFARNVLFPRIMTSTVRPYAKSTVTSRDDGGLDDDDDDDDRDESTKRYDWVALAFACEAGEKDVSEIIISKLLASLVAAIRSNHGNPSSCEAVTVAMALSHVLQNGGSNTCVAYHDLSVPQTVPMDVIHALTTTSVESNNTGQQGFASGRPPLEAGMSSLMLPDTRNEYRLEADRAIKFAYLILPHLITAYEYPIPTEHQDQIISFASQVLPPLSDWDGVKLCVVLPILSIVLSKNDVISPIKAETLTNMAPDLVEYALSTDNDKYARSAAASCIFSIIATHQSNSVECLARTLFRQNILPKIEKLLTEGVSENYTQASYLGQFEDAVNLSGLVGSAAACFGGPSSKTCDDIAQFLCSLSCGSSDAVPSDLGISGPLKCIGHPSLSLIAASALGSMFSVENGNPFWKQRISHLVLPTMLSVHNGGQRKVFSPVQFGVLLGLCHIASCVPLTAFGKEKVYDLTLIVGKGIENCVVAFLTKNENIQNNYITSALFQKIIIMGLSSLLKFLHYSSLTVMPQLSSIVPTLLLISTLSLGAEIIPSQLLALQLLMNIATSSDPDATEICTAHKSKVILHLGHAIDNPSLHIRQAAVNVRNAWCLIE